MKFKKGHTPWNKDTKLTEKHRERISESRQGQASSMKGRTKSNGLYPKQCGFLMGHPHYTTKGDFKKGHKTWNKGQMILIDRICLNCGSKFPTRKNQIERGRGKYCSKICFFKGQLGKICKAKWGKYKGINMRSSYEIKYAKYLDQKRIQWKYEPTTFELDTTTYTPDFYLPVNDRYVEIKGFFRRAAKEKFKLFKEKYPQIKIDLLMEKNLREMGVLN